MDGFDAVASPIRDFTADALALIEPNLLFKVLRDLDLSADGKRLRSFAVLRDRR